MTSFFVQIKVSFFSGILSSLNKQFMLDLQQWFLWNNSAISTDQLRSEQIMTHTDAATEYKTWASKQNKMVAASAKVGVY